MDDYDFDSASGERSNSGIAVPLLFLALGGLFGWKIGKDRAEDDAANWAIQTTQKCEAINKQAGYSSVSECLRAAVDKINEEKQEEAAAEKDDPR